MAICDVCNQTMSLESGTGYTAEEFRTLVSRGFRPEGGTHVALMAVAKGFGYSEQMLTELWKLQVRDSATGWLLCPSCAAKASKIIPKSAGNYTDFLDQLAPAAEREAKQAITGNSTEYLDRLASSAQDEPSPPARLHPSPIRSSRWPYLLLIIFLGTGLAGGLGLLLSETIPVREWLNSARGPRPLSLGEERSLKAGDSFKECAECPELVVVPQGAFRMGSPDSEAGRTSAFRLSAVDWHLLFLEPPGVRPSDKPPTQDGTTERPVHLVSIAKLFAVARFPVTRGQFAQFNKEAVPQLDVGCIAARLATKDDVFPIPFGSNANQPIPGKSVIIQGTSSSADGARSPNGFSFHEPGFAQGDDHPVVCASWNDAQAYAAWISKKTGKRYRLLSEAEREYVARAGTSTPFWWGSDAVGNLANYRSDAEGPPIRGTVPVQSYKPNPFGLYQVHGNVSDWVEDCWHDSYTDAPADGSAWVTGDCRDRVARGGGWYDEPGDMRAGARERLPKSVGFNFYGTIRLARDLAR
jgi:formylglycine-generating enzyme required for sulfatase activity